MTKYHMESTYIELFYKNRRSINILVSFQEQKITLVMKLDIDLIQTAYDQHFNIDLNKLILLGRPTYPQRGQFKCHREIKYSILLKL